MGVRTIIAAPDVTAVYNSFPEEEVLIGDRAEALDARLFLLF